MSDDILEQAKQIAAQEIKATRQISEVVTEFNERFMVVNEAGKALIYAPEFDSIMKRRIYSRMAFRDFQALFMNRMIEVGVNKSGDPVRKSAASVWLAHPDRRQFVGGVVFDPSNSNRRNDVFNLWTGFAVEPKGGNWSLMRRHIEDVICSGDPDHIRYLMGWLARMVQRPAEQGEVAVVMKGGEGTGKGFVARAFKHILGTHGLAISNSKHLVGNFNGHLRDVVFLFADEAFFAGDKAAIGSLKSLITEPYLTIEAKHANAVQMPNYLHVMMASNEEWVVPASQDARRFFVLEVPGTRKNDHAYFAKINAQMETGGYEAMLFDLLNMDLSEFNVRAVPSTEGLQTQRKLSLPIPELWWKDCLERGYVFRSRIGLEDVFGKWIEEASTDLLLASYLEFADNRRERHPMSRETLGTFMTRMGAKRKRLKGAFIGEHIATEAIQYNGTSKVAKPIKGERPPGFSLGKLESSRVGFAKATGLVVQWPDDGLEDDEP